MLKAVLLSDDYGSCAETAEKMLEIISLIASQPMLRGAALERLEAWLGRKTDQLFTQQQTNQHAVSQSENACVKISGSGSCGGGGGGGRGSTTQEDAEALPPAAKRAKGAARAGSAGAATNMKGDSDSGSAASDNYVATNPAAIEIETVLCALNKLNNAGGALRGAHKGARRDIAMWAARFLTAMLSKDDGSGCGGGGGGSDKEEEADEFARKLSVLSTHHHHHRSGGGGGSLSLFCRVVAPAVSFLVDTFDALHDPTALAPLLFRDVILLSGRYNKSGGGTTAFRTVTHNNSHGGGTAIRLTLIAMCRRSPERLFSALLEETLSFMMEHPEGAAVISAPQPSTKSPVLNVYEIVASLNSYMAKWHPQEFAAALQGIFDTCVRQKRWARLASFLYLMLQPEFYSDNFRVFGAASSALVARIKPLHLSFLETEAPQKMDLVADAIGQVVRGETAGTSSTPWFAAFVFACDEHPKVLLNFVNLLVDLVAGVGGTTTTPPPKLFFSRTANIACDLVAYMSILAQQVAMSSSTLASMDNDRPRSENARSRAVSDCLVASLAEHHLTLAELSHRVAKQQRQYGATIAGTTVRKMASHLCLLAACAASAGPAEAFVDLLTYSFEQYHRDASAAAAAAAAAASGSGSGSSGVGATISSPFAPQVSTTTTTTPAAADSAEEFINIGLATIVLGPANTFARFVDRIFTKVGCNLSSWCSSTTVVQHLVDLVFAMRLGDAKATVEGSNSSRSGSAETTGGATGAPHTYLPLLQALVGAWHRGTLLPVLPMLNIGDTRAVLQAIAFAVEDDLYDKALSAEATTAVGKLTITARAAVDALLSAATKVDAGDQDWESARNILMALLHTDLVDYTRAASILVERLALLPHAGRAMRLAEALNPLLSIYLDTKLCTHAIARQLSARIVPQGLPLPTTQLHESLFASVLQQHQQQQIVSGSGGSGSSSLLRGPQAVHQAPTAWDVAAYCTLHGTPVLCELLRALAAACDSNSLRPLLSDFQPVLCGVVLLDLMRWNAVSKLPAKSARTCYAQEVPEESEQRAMSTWAGGKHGQSAAMRGHILDRPHITRTQRIFRILEHSGQDGPVPVLGAVALALPHFTPSEVTATLLDTAHVLIRSGSVSNDGSQGSTGSGASRDGTYDRFKYALEQHLDVPDLAQLYRDYRKHFLTPRGQDAAPE